MPTLAVPKRVHSPGWRSDLGLHGVLGSLQKFAGGWRCALPRVPENPFGNMLLLRGAPDGVAPEAVAALFDEHFEVSRLGQRYIGWDDEDRPH